MKMVRYAAVAKYGIAALVLAAATLAPQQADAFMLMWLFALFALG